MAAALVASRPSCSSARPGLGEAEALLRLPAARRPKRLVGAVAAISAYNPRGTVREQASSKCPPRSSLEIEICSGDRGLPRRAMAPGPSPRRRALTGREPRPARAFSLAAVVVAVAAAAGAAAAAAPPSPPPQSCGDELRREQGRRQGPQPVPVRGGGGRRDNSVILSDRGGFRCNNGQNHQKFYRLSKSVLKQSNGYKTQAAATQAAATAAQRPARWPRPSESLVAVDHPSGRPTGALCDGRSSHHTLLAAPKSVTLA
jgi:hypothetical protein